MVISRTPYRISFFGGGTDYPLWFEKHGGIVLATTIDKYVRITVRHLPPFFEHKFRVIYSKIEQVNEVSQIQHPSVRRTLEWLGWREGLEIHYDGDLPARAGLGSSSAFTVGLLNALMALQGKQISKDELAARAIYIEQQLIKEHVGCQDQICAGYGGFNRIEFMKNKTFDVRPLILSRQRFQELESHLMLFFTRVVRTASDIAKSQLDNFSQREKELSRMANIVDEAIAILQSPTGNLEDFGKLLHETWMYKKTLSPLVSDLHIDSIYSEARSAGAVGGKLLGAGGGGFLLLFVKPEQRETVKRALSHLLHVPFHFENSGSRIMLYQPFEQPSQIA